MSRSKRAASVRTPAVSPATGGGGLGLDRMRTAQRGRVQSVQGDGETRRRLLEMGLCAGVEVQVLRRAPLGDPIELRLRGYLLSLRAEQARFVLVHLDPGGDVT